VIGVALLRGINVGGSNALPMADLRRICAGLGLQEPATYINTGNVVFSAEPADHQALADRIESAVESEFGFRPRVLVRSGEDIVAIAAAIPPGWTNGPQMKADVVYLLDGVDPAAASAQLGPRAGVDHVVLAPGAFGWMVARADATRSGLQRIIGTPLYRQATVRNVNTARKLAALVAQRFGD
jgi:uncharacterized protein (DUF1697 family)